MGLEWKSFNTTGFILKSIIRDKKQWNNQTWILFVSVLDKLSDIISRE